MTVRERFLSVMNFKPVDRLPAIEMFPWWTKTVDRWHTEGLEKSLCEREEICESLGLETYKLRWFSRERARIRHLGHIGADGTKEDYLNKKAQLFPKNAVDAKEWSEWARLQEKGETVVWVELDGFFWFPREVLGVERNLYAGYDEPDMLELLNNDLLDYTFEILEEVSRYCFPDLIMISEDMTYNQGPMISKEAFDRFVAPYYKRLVPYLKEKGALVFVDTDGNTDAVAEWFSNLGVDGLLPNERRAGVDISLLRTRFPKMRFIGGFDKTIMCLGEEAMRREFERLLPVAKQGGYIISCDHQTPPEVSFENYKLYLKLLREYNQKAVQ